MTPAALEAYPAGPTTTSIRDVVALAKPRITLLVATTTAGGLWLAPGRPARWTALLTLLGVTMIVSGANTLNMYIERDIDGRMERTKSRPLPAGRMTPAFALAFGLTASVAGAAVLALGVNLTTAMLAVLAHLSYVLAYTRHRALMQSAVAVSALFLVSYSVRVVLTGTHRFPGSGWLRGVYLAVLGSHTTLAMIALPLVLVTLWLARTDRIAVHRRLARVTLPVWLYMSLTGVLVYVMLYHVERV
jgi:uncharacterized membrane protein YozB (DUF420 family)